MPARAQVQPVFCSSILSVGTGAWTSSLQAQPTGDRMSVANFFFSREENLSESPQAFLPFQRPELDHMLIFKPINWQEWNLHDSWQLGPQPTFPKIQGHADKSGFLRKKVEVLLERRVMKGCRGKQPIGCATIIKKIFSFFRTLYLALIGNTKKHNLILNQQHTHILTF